MIRRVPKWVISCFVISLFFCIGIGLASHSISEAFAGFFFILSGLIALVMFVRWIENNS